MKNARTSTPVAARNTTTPTTPAAATKKFQVKNYGCCNRKVVVEVGHTANIDTCRECARARRENNLAAKRPLRVGLIAASEVAELQSVVRAANRERDVALTAQAVKLATRQGWEEAWGRHLATTADALGSTMDNPVVRELAVETFRG